MDTQNKWNSLSAERIRNADKTALSGGNIVVLEETESTNSTAKLLAAKGAPHGTIVAAESQTRGRGRLGRRFESPKGAGLYMSVIVRPSFDIAFAPLITSAAAVAAAESVEKLCGEYTAVKWVNDLYMNGRKICGILTESAIDSKGRLDYAVIGIGINVGRTEFPPELRDTATSVEAETGKIIDRNILCGEILVRLEYYLENIEEKRHIGEYRRRELLTGNHITANTGGREVEGYAVGINENANLLLKLADGSEMVLASGEANLCRIRREK